MLLTNGFSLNMLKRIRTTKIVFHPISVDDVKIMIEQSGLDSAIGHESTAKILSGILGVIVPNNRKDIAIDSGDGRDVVAAQYTGPRLPEGATTLPDGAEIIFWIVGVEQIFAERGDILVCEWCGDEILPRDGGRCRNRECVNCA